MRAGFDPKRVVFAGVGKTERELMAGLGERILLFNVESASELEHLDRLASRHGKRARVALRVNPDVDAGTHDTSPPEGLSTSSASPLTRRSRSPSGWGSTGALTSSGFTSTLDPRSARPFTESVEKSALVEELKNRGFDIRYFNMGGGLGIRYKDEEAPSPEELVAAVRPTLEATGTKILCEMGRYIAGGAGALLTRVIYRKKSGEKDFIVADAGMNDLLRPSLYDAHHECAR